MQYQVHFRRGVMVCCLAVGGGLGSSGWWRMWQFSPSVPVCPVAQSVAARFVEGNELNEKSQSATLVVDVSGAVIKPGVYNLPRGARVIEAVTAAGGIDTQQADAVALQSAVNLAAVLTDGQKVTIPQLGVELSDSSNNREKDPIIKKLISINTGSTSELQSLPGIGEKRAGDIIANRPYQSLIDLVNSQTLTQNQFNALQELISL